MFMSSYEQLFICLRSFLARAAVALVLASLTPPAMAHVQADAPWHPIAYAYRNAVFLLNLDPIDWALIERIFTTDHDGRIIGRPASVRLQALDQEEDMAYWPAIETALAAKRPNALFGAATRAISGAIRRHLKNAAASLDMPSVAGAEIDEAQALYRAFADFIRQTDPDGFRALGLAWLEMASSVRQADLASVGSLPADLAAFAAARTVIVDYLQRNYEPETVAPRKVYAPIPEERLQADPHLKVAPWLPPGSDINDQVPLPRLVLNFEKQGIDEEKLFLVAFGDMLFDSPEIFGSPAKDLKLSCATCHNRSDVNQRFFIPGISPHPGAVDVDGSFFNARFNDFRSDPIDIPSLRGLRFTAPYGRDGRFASLRDFTRNVIVNEFNGEEPSPMILDALVVYMTEFDFLPAPNLERDGRLNADASDAAKRGEQLFNKPFAAMNGRSCASCHLPSSHFTDNLVHDIGSAGDGAASGFSGAFDTPTLLGINYTAPYFHDGRFQTLAQVVAWFDQQFGLGLGDQERADLTAYLEAVGESADPYERFDEENTPFRLMIEELSVFLSTLDTLIPDQDQANADLLLRSVASDMELDASAMTNREAKELALELAELLWQIRDMVNREAWDEAATAWQAYRETAERYNSELR